MGALIVVGPRLSVSGYPTVVVLLRCYGIWSLLHLNSVGVKQVH